MKANKEFRNQIAICQNCNKEFHPRYSSDGKFCCLKCQKEYLHKIKYQLFINGDESLQRANYSPKIFYEDIMK